jgi:RNA polymerase sigma-70 factor (ECF subfamily)
MNQTYNVVSGRRLEPEIDELTLVELSQQGNQDMFAHLYEAYVERIYRYILFRVADDMVAEDITSHVFMKAWEKLGTYQAGKSPFMAWLYRIAHNAVIDHYRVKKVSIPFEQVNPVQLSHVDELDERLDMQARSRQLHQALQELTEQQQQVLILKFVGGLNTMEIAQQLGKRQGAVRALQMRGLQGLAKCPALQSEQIYTL